MNARAMYSIFSPSILKVDAGSPNCVPAKSEYITLMVREHFLKL